MQGINPTYLQQIQPYLSDRNKFLPLTKSRVKHCIVSTCMARKHKI